MADHGWKPYMLKTNDGSSVSELLTIIITLKIMRFICVSLVRH